MQPRDTVKVYAVALPSVGGLPADLIHFRRSRAVPLALGPGLSTAGSAVKFTGCAAGATGSATGAAGTIGGAGNSGGAGTTGGVTVTVGGVPVVSARLRGLLHGGSSAGEDAAPLGSGAVSGGPIEGGGVPPGLRNLQMAAASSLAPPAPLGAAGGPSGGPGGPPSGPGGLGWQNARAHTSSSSTHRDMARSHRWSGVRGRDVL